MKQNVCNICGANYEYRNGRWVCPACGAYKSEELSNEEVTLLYTAAQKLRIGDFSEAENEYSDIVIKYPKNSSGYWGRLLSRYGIKYEEDFDGRKIPTCYATSIESVLHDKDYLKALELADGDSKKYYTEQAGYIERVRKEWVEKAKKEKPYDIFICYKDSDLPNGIDRTKDSIAAQELYIHLTEQGYRVFFSRESLRDKVGEKYEPYIFNALSTAKVMLVYGSSAEYITSTWLKNEWTRYEKRLQAGEKKPNSLIVACDGFSPSELPSALSSMQCMDATKRTFYSDLDAQIKRIIKGEDKPKPTAVEKPQKKSKKLPIAISVISVLIAVVLCILIPNVLNNKPTSSVMDSKYGVVVSADGKIFDKNTSVIVDKLTDGTQYSSLISAANSRKEIDIQNAVIYDIECDSEITDEVTIKVAYAKNKADTTVKVYYISDDKSKVEEHSCTYENGFVTFKTTHLSYYLIGELTSATNPPVVTPSDNLTLEQGVLTVGVCANYEPYEYVEDGKFKGIEIDILKAIGTDLGLRVEFKNYAFEDLLTNLTDNKLDCIIGVTQTVQRDEQALATKPMFSEEDAEYIIYVNKSNSKLKEKLNTSIDKLNQNNTIDSIIAVYESGSTTEYTTILFNANGGMGTMKDQSIPHNSTDKLRECSFSKEGYVFGGWSKSEGSVTADYADEASFSVASSGAIILYAVWVPNENTIVFNSNGGIGTMDAQHIRTDDAANLKSCTFSRDGYIFAGWAISVDGDVSFTDQATYTMGANSEYTLYAVWTTADYAITYHLNGGTNDSTNPVGYDVTDATITLKAPTRAGYTFVSWCSDSSLYTQCNTISSGSTGAKVFYAKWTANQNTIIFNSNGGEGNMPNANAMTDNTIVLPNNVYTRKGYIFIGWASVTNGSVEYINGASYSMGTNSTNTLYAVWRVVPYSIAYNTNGGAIFGEHTEYSVETASFTLVAPTKIGCTFIGWSGTDITGVQKTVTVSKGSTGNRNYTANWQANEYTITLNANDGTVSSNSIKVTYGSAVNMPVPARVGYTFDGWYNGTTKYEGGKWQTANNLTLTAKWIANTNTPYIVKHYKQNANNNEYTLADMQNLTGTSDSSISPAVNTYTGFVTPTQQIVNINADGSLVVNYYYFRNTYNVVLSANGGDVLSNQTYKYEQALALPTPSRTGYTFGGWYSDEELTILVQPISVISNMKLYAWWIEENKPSDFDYSKSSTSIIIYEYCGSNSTMVIPSYIGGLPVTTICPSAFKANTTIVTAVLPERLSIISDNMFENCTSLTEVKNYNAVSSIGKYAFSGCTSLKKFNSSKDYELIINDGVNTIGTYAFKNVALVQKIVVPNSVTKINTAAFNGCNGLKDLTIPFVGRERSNTTYYNNLGFIFSEEYRYSEPENSIRQDTYDSYSFPFVIPLGIEIITVTDTNLIGRGAFHNLNFVRSIIIDCTIEQIDCNAFSGLTTATTIIYSGTIEEWQKIEKYTAPYANWGGKSLNFSCVDGAIIGG